MIHRGFEYIFEYSYIFCKFRQKALRLRRQTAPHCFSYWSEEIFEQKGRFSMKRITKRTAALLTASLMLAGAMTACGSSNDNKQSSASTNEGSSGKTYQIVADNAFAPFDFMDPDTNEYTGIDMDLLAAIAEDQGFQYEVNNCGWDTALSSLGAGQADGMIAGMTITEERLESYDFSDPYFEDGQIMIVKGDSTIASYEDLAGKTVAAKSGTQSEKYAMSIADQYGFKVVSYKDSPTVYTAVINGNDAAGFEDYSVINYQIVAQSLDLKTVGDKVNAGPYGLAVLKGNNAELIEMFNAGLANIKENGTYDEILTKYGITE